MACFIAPVTEAIVTTLATKVVKTHEQQQGITAETTALPLSQKLGWLNKMLWGGSALLALEHLLHGEIVPVYPFLTAPDGISVWHEILTTGIGMCVAVTAVWTVLAAAAGRVRKKATAKAEI